ncbi:hypothetical protein [Endozoicomonas sp. Mp262]|uniref:hypothetical protein n=1 Tax=Endozoicomonas sp. Mp262 TaxID=2919499 RepID=UPI0021D7FCB4
MTIALSSLLLPDAPKNEPPPEHSDWRSLDIYNKSIFHQTYHCPIYSWLAEGWIKNRKKPARKRYFLYVEYRSPCRSSQSIALSFATLEQACQYQNTELPYQLLPGISPETTRRFPIKK